DGRFPSDSLALKIIDNLEKCRQVSNQILDETLYREKKFYFRQLVITIALLFVVSFIVACFFAFRLLSMHFTQMLGYIQGLYQGRFSSPLYTDPNEEMGRIALSFHKMGRSIEYIINKLQELSRSLEESTKTIDKTTHEQAGIALL